MRIDGAKSPYGLGIRSQFVTHRAVNFLHFNSSWTFSSMLPTFIFNSSEISRKVLFFENETAWFSTEGCECKFMSGLSAFKILIMTLKWTPLPSQIYG